MNLNPYVIKKWLAFFISGFVPFIMYNLCVLFLGLDILISIGVTIITLILIVFISNMLIRTPFRDLLEGKGFIVLNIDSSGIINTYIAPLIGNQIYLKTRSGKEIKARYTREMSSYISTPRKANYIQKERGDLVITLPTNRKKYEFGLMHYPCFIYNEQLGAFISKEELSGKQNKILLEHLILTINDKLDYMLKQNDQVARYYMDKLFSQSGLAGIVRSPLFWIIVIGILLVIVIVFGPAILNMGGVATNITAKGAGTLLS